MRERPVVDESPSNPFATTRSDQILSVRGDSLRMDQASSKSRAKAG